MAAYSIKTGDYSYTEKLGDYSKTITFKTAEELDGFLRAGGFSQYPTEDSVDPTEEKTELEIASDGKTPNFSQSVMDLLRNFSQPSEINSRKIQPPPEGRIALSTLYYHIQCDSVGLEGEAQLPPNTQAVLTKLPSGAIEVPMAFTGVLTRLFDKPCDCGGAKTGTTHSDWCSSLQS